MKPVGARGARRSTLWWTCAVADRVVVKGRAAAVSIYELLDCDTEPIRAQKRATQERFAEALATYRGGDFKAACSIFEACVEGAPDDNAAKLYVARCADLLRNPPEEPWQGVWVLDEK